jgi:DNA-binding CsgD family transcriptional regulator
MSRSILAENEGKRLSPGLPWLCCFALFTAWQIGVFSYSGAALMVEGRLPLGVDEGNFTPLISLGYILSIAWILALPRRIVWAERVMAGAALLAALALQLLFYGKLPERVWPAYVGKGTTLACPTRLFAGLFTLCFLGNILISFGISVAESVEHGLFAFYMSFAVFAIAGYARLRRCGLSPLRFASIDVLVSVTGFILAIVTLYVPVLALPACVLLGPGTAACILIPYYGVVMSKRCPSRFISPAISGISFVASVLLLAWLIKAFRENTTLLYTLYLAIAVAMAVVYLFLEPYLLYSFRGKALISEEEIAGIARAGAATESSLTESSLTTWQRNLAANAFDKLSAKELAIAELLMQGFKYEVICSRLHISKNTAYWYRRQLFDKLQIGSLQELFALAEKQGRDGDG